MRPSRQAVPQHLRALLDRLAKHGIARDFYLAGGTGLALLLDHRRSVDLDFFSRTNRLEFSGRRALFADLRRVSTWRVLEEKDGTVHGLMGRVRVSFFWYDVPLVKPVIRWGALRIASLEDIGLMKIVAIIGRGSRKDFVDLYTICQRISLSRLLTLGRRKFRDSRDFSLQALKALCFFKDAEQEPALVMVKPISWEGMKAFFTHEVKQLTRTYRRST